MAWMNMSPQVHNTFASLVIKNGDTISVNSDCLAILENIHNQLNAEDSNLRTFRRGIGFSRNIPNDLIPLLIHVKDNKYITDGAKIVDCIIKLLLDLTIPIEYLLPMDLMHGSDVEKHSIFELNNLLSTGKEAFSDGKSTKAVMDHMKQIIDSNPELNLEQCHSVNNCLLLLRNILHIPENSSTTHSPLQNQIVWNLFTQSIDKIIIYLILCPQKVFWSVTMVQLIALLYKDQHVGTLQKLLNIWPEGSLSESSEDNESNTSTPFQEIEDSSPVVTSDPTSDSSDTGGGNEVVMQTEDVVNESRSAQSRSKVMSELKRVPSTETEASSSSGVYSMTSQSSDSKSPTSSFVEQICPPTKRQCIEMTSEISDCGYGTQAENQEFVSTSSNDDDQPTAKPVHHKPHTFQKTRYITGKKASTTLEKKELRRKKLVKRSKTTAINMKCLANHLPTDEDITHVLKEFTVDFLLKGYGILVQDLHIQLLSNIHVNIDTSHFFWLVTYFLKFATQLELDLVHISPALCYDLLCYLVFQGAWVLEELDIKSKTACMDLKPCLRRLHLVVTGLREFLQAVETYQKFSHLNEEDRNVLLHLQIQIAETGELGSLFLLLLRQYNSKLQGKQYLQDLILTNHNYLLFMDNVAKITKSSKFNLMDHLKKFAAVEIISQYGILLENFKENGAFVNNCIFTMMHHIGGDLENVPILFQPSILKTFSQIWETDFEVCDDWSDLIEYVIHKFINTSRSTHCLSVDFSSNDPDSSAELYEKSEWSDEEKEYLLQYYNQNSDSPDMINRITTKYKESGMTHRNQVAIVKELLSQNIINENQYHDFMKSDPLNIPSDSEEVMEMNEYISEENCSVDKAVDSLKRQLIREGKGKMLIWLQEVLLEFCYGKLLQENAIRCENDKPIVESSVYYHLLLNLPIPLIPWTVDQNDSLTSPHFNILLHTLGCYLPEDTGKIYVRIPNFWTSDLIYSKAQQLGPINRNKLKFDADLFKGPKDSPGFLGEYAETNPTDQTKFFYDSKETPSLFRFTPLPNTHDWSPSSLLPDTTILADSSSSHNSQNSRTSQLSIAIPETIIPCNLPAPELALVPTELLQSSCDIDMDCTPMLQEDIDYNSACDNVSDLTGMYVSDEDDIRTIISIDQKLF